MLAARVGGCVSSQPRALACQSRPSRRARLAARHPACQAAQQLEGPRASAPLEDAAPRHRLDDGPQPQRPGEATRKLFSDQFTDDEQMTRDQPKESSRKYQRTLSYFTWDRWASHRSTWRYVRHMRGIFKSSIVRGLRAPLLYVGALATATCTYEQLLMDAVLPGWMPSLQMPTAPFDLTSFALSLLLVFRTNTSYDRWTESCSLWAQIGNTARDMLRQVLTGSAVRGGADSPLPAAVARWLLAYVRALKAQLTEDSNLRKELQGVLEPEEVEALASAWHPPSFALAVLSELVAAAGAPAGGPGVAAVPTVGPAAGLGLRDTQLTRLDESLSELEGALGACEKILRTPIPLSYTRHTSRFLVIWLSTLPLGLYSAGCHWMTIPLSLVIAFLLLGIEEIGVQIEEPFGLLPLDELCTEIEGDLFAMLRESTKAKSTAASAAAAAAATATAAAALGGFDGDVMPAASFGASGILGSVGAPGGSANNSVLWREMAIFTAMRRKLAASAAADSNGSGSGSASAAGGSSAASSSSSLHREWSEVGGRARLGARSPAEADAIFSSLDDDV